MIVVKKENKEILLELESTLTINCDVYKNEIEATYVALDKDQTIKLLFEKNAGLWTKDAEQTKGISQRLGWLNLPDQYLDNANVLEKFPTQIKLEGFKAIVLLGMGGSSLCSEVTRETFGSKDHYPQLFVLDNTDPEAILDLEKKIKIDKSLFIIASKSGDTKETISFFRYFYDQVEKTKMTKPGENFVAITDEATPLAKIAEQYQFKHLVLNPSDIGGRYSVLSNFGLLPMALIGIDLKTLLKNASSMMSSCKNLPASKNPGVQLGVVLGICQQQGRDKITFVLSASISALGYWLEQLLAESTGKDQIGLIPVNGERLGGPEVYDNDRVFVHIYLADDDLQEDAEKVLHLEQNGHPVIRIKIKDKTALGGEYYRWQIAVAICGTIMGINPFDQPDVEASKTNTEKLLKFRQKKQTFENNSPLLNRNNVEIYTGATTDGLLVDAETSPGELINRFIALANPGDYIALLPYFFMTEARVALLQTWRRHIRDSSKHAITLLNGPRYLHSTGQLHKGGPNTGLYIVLTGDTEEDVSIPGQTYTFSTLQMAQALGDFRALDEKARRVIRIHFTKDKDLGLAELYRSIQAANK